MKRERENGRKGEGAFRDRIACRACGREFPATARAACDCGGMLDPLYDARVWSSLDRDAFVPDTIWTWSPFLPCSLSPRCSLSVRGGPLVDAPRLARRYGLRRLRLKLDSYAYPSWSFKDRPVAVAINRALELGFKTVACPSTGNLANSVAAQAAAAGLEAWILVPESIEPMKTLASAVYGRRLVRVAASYDEINALCHEAAALGWGVVNVNLRAYYAEGSKTLAYEIAAECGWTPPSAVVAPMAGGALVTKLAQGFGELASLGWVSARPHIYGSQAEGCAPIVAAFDANTETITPVTPHTTCQSLAIGNPVDGRWAVHALRTTNGGGVAVSDAELLAGIMTLAAQEGVFTETAGGVVIAALERLARAGALTRDDDVVAVLTGNGLKTMDALPAPALPVIPPTLDALEALA